VNNAFLLGLLLRHILRHRAVGDYYARHLFLELARHYAPFFGVHSAIGVMCVSPHDRVIGQALFFKGAWEDTENLRAATEVVRTINVLNPKRRLFVDVGANVGTTSISAIRSGLFDTAIAIEPDPWNSALLRQSIAANRLEGRIVPLNVALSDGIREGTLERSPVNHGDYRIRVNKDQGSASAMDETSWETVSVSCTTFDHLVDRGLIELSDVGMVWMDTQGHEGHILRGARSLLASDIPVVIEFWPYALERAGTLASLVELIALHYPWIADLGGRDGGTPALRKGTDVTELWEKYTEYTATDLLLLKGAGGYGSVVS
jgi:FkbM family methyltransferase